MLMTLDHFYGGAGELFSFYRIQNRLEGFLLQN